MAMLYDDRKKVIVYAVALPIIVGAVQVNAGVDFFFGKTVTGPPIEIAEELMKMAVERFQPQLPTQVDEWSMLTALSSEGATMTYSYRMIPGADHGPSSDFLNDITPLVLQNQCSSPNSALMLGLGGTLRSVYTAADTSPLGDIWVSLPDCEGVSEIEDYTQLESMSLKINY